MDEARSMSTRTDAQAPHAEFFPTAPELSGSPPRWRLTLREDARELSRFWPVIQNMVVQELRVRYQRSILGFFWTLLNPILMMVTLTVVFSKLLNQGAREYAIHLFAGMVPWALFSQTINECAFCIITNENLIRKIYLPKLVFPLVRLLVNLTTFTLSVAAMFLMLVPLGARFSWAMLFLPVAAGLFALFTLGLGLIVATANTFYRDCSHLVGVALQAWYFATPIIYELDLMPPETQWRFWLNPAFPFIRMFQVVIQDGRWPDPTTFAMAVGLATVILGVGYAAFKSYEDQLVFRL
jgi:ABC-type polysaccharide/polyol phosphate export permease